jgi:AcrR family transcriptional regulator
MARVAKKAEERRTEILDAAQGLFLSRGYDAITVNDLLNAVGISKGAFYHHFSAKGEVLQVLVWRLAEQGLAALSPIIEREDQEAGARSARADQSDEGDRRAQEVTSHPLVRSGENPSLRRGRRCSIRICCS